MAQSLSQNTLDIGDVKNGHVDGGDPARHRLINERIPPADFKFPAKAYKDKRKPGGLLNRYCQREWFTTFPFIAYSQKGDGLYCLCCVLFPSPSKHGQPRLLVSKPYNNWKDAKTDLKGHAACNYHRDADARMDGFLKTMAMPSTRIDLSMNSQTAQRVKKNRAFLKSVIKCIELCGRQGIALRGHRDDSTADQLSNKGNFHALLRLRVDAGDQDLQTHLETCNRNSTYVSKTSQNDLLDCIRVYIQSQIVCQIKAQSVGPHYGIMADEVTDSSRWEQLGLVVRYVRHTHPVERLLMFLDCEQITGEAICQKLVSGLTDAGLDPVCCRSQCFDGAGNMAGLENGCAANFRKVAPRAPYFHCASHDFNLVLCKACKVPTIHCMLENLKALGVFFKYSPKRTRRLEQSIDRVNEERKTSGAKQITKVKIKPMCETRWVEKHSCLEDLQEMFEAVIDCLEAITTERKWDAKAVTEANGLLSQITSSPFISAFQSVRYVFGYTKSLSICLQSSTIDLVNAYQQINLVAAELSDIRTKAEEIFHDVYMKCCEISQMAGREMQIPRRCGRQTLRNNVEADTPEAYYRRSTFLPLLDNMVQQMADRFPDLTSHATRGLHLIPANLEDLQEDHVDELRSYYEDDMPSPASFQQEIRLWRRLWSGVHDKPSTLQATLEAKAYNPLLYPNIHTVLHHLLLSPVTSAGVERANSSLKFVKSVHRSTMTEGRLNALLLLFVHRDIPLDLDKIVDAYAAKHPRRMLFINPLSRDQDDQKAD